MIISSCKTIDWSVSLVRYICGACSF